MFIPFFFSHARATLTSYEMKHGSSKNELVLHFFRSANVRALHPDKAEYHAEEAESYPAHEQSTDPLDKSYGITGSSRSN